MENANVRRERPHGLVTEVARAIGWLTVGAGVSRLPGGEKREQTTHPIARSIAVPVLVRVVASIAGVILALFPRGDRREPPVTPRVA